MRTKTSGRVVIRGADREAVVAAAESAAAALESGRLVVAPTETVYGLFGSARTPGIVSLFKKVRITHGSRAVEAESTDNGLAAEPPCTWHAGSHDDVERVVALPTAVHRRLVRGLLPGPVRFVIEQTEESIHRLLGALNVPAAVITTEGDATGWVAVRVPSLPAARELIQAADSPLVAERVGGTIFRDADHPDHRAAEGLPDTPESGGLLGAVLDAGTLVRTPPSTTVRLRLSGAFEVSQTGAISEETVLATLRQTVLFVCTGNTCRSPMAEAIARAMISQRTNEDGTEMVVGSAGVMAGDGMPATPEAAEAVRSMRGDLSNHRSRGLSRAMVAEADRVFVMTESHGDRARALIGPGESAKIERLDPDGDIPDPIGGPQAVYRETAERIRSAIKRRFEEFGV